MSASPAPEANTPWKEYKNAEGRIYWSHAITKQSVWEKPDELKTPFERAMAKTDWKQFTSKGKPYFVNSMTKETVWEMPAELQMLQNKVEAEEIQKREREHRRATGQESPVPERDASRSPSPEVESTALTRAGSHNHSTAHSPAPVKEVETVVIPPGGFRSHQEAEDAFIHLLKREKIDEKWTWDQTMRHIVLDPLYKALGTLAQKKAAYEKWLNSLAADKQHQKEARIAELRPHLTRLFANSGVIKSYSTMKTADTAFAMDKYWRRAKPDERRLILDDYVTELRNRETAARKDAKTRNVAALTKLIKDMDITVTTPWRAAHDIILRSDGFRADRELQKMETIDILNVYDDYSRQLEKEFDEESKRLYVQQRRKARKARDGFKDLLRELRDRRVLTHASKWKDMHPHIHKDERYIALLGLPGSSPLDLWMDAVDDLQIEAEDRAGKIEPALATPVALETTWGQFKELYDASSLGNDFGEDELREVYDVIHTRLAKAAADEKRRAERKRRHRIEDLQYALKKITRHIDLAQPVEAAYDAALPHMQDLPEFKDIKEEEDRRAAFDKFVRRLKEKAAGGESSRTREREREREREYRMDVDDERERRREREYRDRERERGRRTGDKSEEGDWRRDREERDRDAHRSDRRERERDRDRDRDRDYRRGDREREREYRDDREYRDRERDRDRERRDRRSDPRDRSERERDRDREPTRDRDRERERDSRTPRDTHTRDRDRSLDHDGRDPKRRRLSTSVSVSDAPGTAGNGKDDEEREEGEI